MAAKMAHPARQEKADAIVIAMDAMLKAYIARYIHMATNDDPVIKARRDLADLLADAIR